MNISKDRNSDFFFYFAQHAKTFFNICPTFFRTLPTFEPFFSSGVGVGFGVSCLRGDAGDDNGDGLGSNVGLGLAGTTMSVTGVAFLARSASVIPIRTIAASTAAVNSSSFLDFLVPLTDTETRGKERWFTVTTAGPEALSTLPRAT